MSRGLGDVYKRQGIGFTRFNSKDVVRHPLVKKIVDAYNKRLEEN